MGDREGTGGGTGFLFGNIDKRGRLDEDYMSDEAKDTIDNIGSKVVQKDRDLVEITNALPQAKRSAGDSSDDDDYDDDASAGDNTQGASSRVDYYDEDDLLDDGMDEKERTDMAAFALKKAEAKDKPDDDDENYDDDDDETKPAPKVVAPPLKIVSTPAPIAPPTPVDSALAEQQRLMAQAKELAEKAPEDILPAPVVDTDEHENPLQFSKLFTKQPPPLKFKPRRRRFGVVVNDIGKADPEVEADDGEDLDRPQTPDAVDPVELILAMDAGNETVVMPEADVQAKQRGTQSEEQIERNAGREKLGAEQEIGEGDEEEVGLTMPLGTEKGERDQDSGELAEVGAELVQQLPWEDKIRWRDDDDSEEESWNGDRMDIDTENELGTGTKPAGKPDVAMNGDDDDDNDDDDDDDEFEEPVMLNVGNLSAGESTKRADEAKESDSDDDMEWEDGNEAASNAPGEIKNEDKPAQAPNEKVPLSKPNPPPLRAIPAPQYSQASNAGQTKPGTMPERNEEPSEKTASPTPSGKFGGMPALRSVAVAVKPTVRGQNPAKKIIQRVIAPNKTLEGGLWLQNVIWDVPTGFRSKHEERKIQAAQRDRTAKKVVPLILDVSDPNMIFEDLSDDSQEGFTQAPPLSEVRNGFWIKTRMLELVHSSGTQVQQLLESDPYNISNDVYYASGVSNFLKVDRRSVLRGLQNAPPAVKCLTTRTIPTESELLSFHRPILTEEFLPSATMIITPFRRKRPKGGHAQIAGQIPKKKTELFCSEKDAYRVSLYEYALERQPCILPIPGMASRIITYARKESSAAAAQAMKNAAGTAEADTIFMSPDEPPPLHSGDLLADEPPLSVVESHAYAAPCVRRTPPSTDFLLVRNGDNMFVREIDSVVSLGVTEPKVEIMAPNAERFKRYSRERALLWVLREFSRMRKDLAKQQKEKRGPSRDDPSVFFDGGKVQKEKRGSRDESAIILDKEAITKEFGGRKTYSETVLFKMIKEFTKYHNGRYTLIEDPNKSLAMREVEALRTVTPQETAAFESMEAGWENLLNRGIQIFTHPSHQGNITMAAESSGLEAGPAVGQYIKSQLLKTPWYRSQNIISAHRQQKKELMQVLTLARIVNDLKEGGAVMESRLMSLTAAEMNNVLINHYRVNNKKIPADIEERRVMVRETAQKKGKTSAQDLTDYPKLIANVLRKHRNLGVIKSGANAPNSQPITGTFLGMPLEVQRRALEEGDVDDLQTEDEEFAPDLEAAAALAANSEDAFGKLPSPKDKDGKTLISKRKPPRPKSFKKGPVTTGQAQDGMKKAEGQAESRPLQEKPSAATAKFPKPRVDGQVKKPKKRVTRLKCTKKVVDADGTERNVVTTVTDPVEIARLLEKKEKKKSSEGAGASTGKLKVAIDMRMLQMGSKSTGKKKLATGVERKKPPKKPVPKPGGPSASEPVRKSAEKAGPIGKVKISTKQLRQEREQAALKRKRSQYGDDIDYRAKKVAKTSRRKRNGAVQLNNILERVEKAIRETDGYVASSTPVLKIARLKDGESPPPGVLASNLAAPKGTGLDFTIPVDTKAVPTYKQIVKKPMYLNLIRQNCKRTVYNSAADFIADMELLVKNATDFNRLPEAQWVVQHANLLLEVAVEQISRRADEISAAEEMIKLEKSETKASGSSSKSKKKGSDKKGQGNKKGQGSKKKKAVPPGAVIDVDDEKGSGAAVKTPQVIDLDEDDVGISGEPGGPSADLDAEVSGDPMATPSAAASPFPNASPGLDASPIPAASPPLFDAGMTGDMYSSDAPMMSGDGAEEDAGENLVLDLDNIGED
eukprot:GFKZ01010695.1.p1 GENE.GFKZ01010695.1~~GFKZ01010695.1.p1  ORF type:complete len:1802 (-),score=389.54 GFKZ01010695.1:87-5492(-)